MNKPLLIGLAGFARSGKTTIAKILETEHGFTHMSFAAPIRLFATIFFSQLMPTFDLEKHKTMSFGELGEGVTPRKFMQAMGTEGGRLGVHPDLWANFTMTRALHELHGAERSVVISDVRFPNEAKAIREAGGFVLWVARPGCEPAGHASEAGLPVHLCDTILHNDGLLERMPEYISKFLGTLHHWQLWRDEPNKENEHA